MEKCITDMVYMNKKIKSAFFLLALFVSCATKPTPFIYQDLTDRQIQQKQLENLMQLQKKSPLLALWRTALLDKAINSSTNEATQNTDIPRFFVELLDVLVSDMKKFSEKQEWISCLEVGESILALHQGYEFLFADFNQLDTVKMLTETAKNAKNNIFEHVSYENPPTFEQMISGTVTIWLDLGVKIQKGRAFPDRVIGSGFYIDKRGYIVTNYHVIEKLADSSYEGYGRLYVKAAGDSKNRIPAKLIGYDKALDLALLKTEAPVPFVFALGSSKNLYVGRPIYAIGSPVGLESTITSGIVSAVERKLLPRAAVVQIDAAVNAGNSGGPIVSKDGVVEGIVFAGLPEFESLNFAIPVEYLLLIRDRMYIQGEVLHSWLGCSGHTQVNGDGVETGVHIDYVMNGSPADYAGLQAGCVITQFNFSPIDSVEKLNLALLNKTAESIVWIEFKTKENELQKTLICTEERPENPVSEMKERDLEYKVMLPAFGMELVPVSVRNKRNFTVRSLIRGSIADESGFSENDAIQLIFTRIEKKDGVIVSEIYAKKRKNAYLEANIVIVAPLDSPLFF